VDSQDTDYLKTSDLGLWKAQNHTLPADDLTWLLEKWPLLPSLMEFCLPGPFLSSEHCSDVLLFFLRH
jgi:hypothetical protein